MSASELSSKTRRIHTTWLKIGVLLVQWILNVLVLHVNKVCFFFLFLLHCIALENTMDDPTVKYLNELMCEIRSNLLAIGERLTAIEIKQEELNVYIQKCKESDARILRKKQEKRAILARCYN